MSERCEMCGSTEHVVESSGDTYSGMEILTAPCVPKDKFIVFTEPLVYERREWEWMGDEAPAHEAKVLRYEQLGREDPS